MAQIRINRPAAEHGVLAFLLPYCDRNRWPNGYHRLLAGAGQRAGALGYRVEVFGFADPGVTMGGLERNFRTRAIHGLLLCPLYEDDPKLELDWRQFALAQMSSHSVAPELHLATTHPFATVQVCTEKLLELGYRRIGLHVEKKIDVKLQGEWSAALFHSQQRVAPADRVPPLLQERLEEAEFAAWIREWRPDVILTKHIRTKRWLSNLGLRIPGDIGLAHLDWRPDFNRCAGLRQHADVVAAMAVDLVVEQLYHNERGVPRHAKTLLVKGVWVDGATLAARGAKRTPRGRVLVRSGATRQAR
jgi:DNA-binding LacI/PurR family transcriptional regulator